MGSKDQSTDRPRRRGRKLRRVLLGLLVLAVVLVALGPTIAGPIARPIVEGAVNDKIKGRATIESLGLSWLGAQRASLTLDDPGGGRVADVTVRADRGLLGLALGSRRLGIVYVRGEATIVRDADGSTNLQRAIEPRFPSAAPEPGGGGGPVQLPGSLAASVVLDGVRVTYQDGAIAEQTGGKIGAVRLGALTGSLDFAVGKPVGVTIEGPIATGADLAGLAESGAVSLRVQVTDLTDAAGVLTPEALRADVALTLRAPALDMAVNAAFGEGVVRSTGETRVTVSGAELAGLLPRVGEALAAQQGVRIDRLPTLTVALDEFSVPTDADLRRASASVKLTTSAIGGSVDLPTGETVMASPFGIEPLEISVLAPSLAETVTVRGGTRATIGGESAGAFSIDLALGGLLDEAGAVRAGVPGSIAGGVRVEGFSTPILQPFVAAVNTALPAGARLDLPEDLGPALDLALSATSHTDGSGAYDVDLALESEQAKVDASVVIAGQRVASRGEGVRADLRRLAPMIDRFTAAHGVRVNRGGAVTVQVSEFSVDLAKLAGGEAGPDLRGTTAALDITLTDVIGQMQLAGDTGLRDFRLERFAFGLATDDLAGEVRLTSDASGRLNGSPFATMNTDLTLAGLLDAAGAPATGSLPTLRGEVRASALSLATVDTVFGPLYAQSGLVLTREIGPSAEILLLAASDPQAGPDATNVDLTFRSSNVDITAPLTLTPDRVRTREPVTLVDRAAGASASKLLEGKLPVAVQPGAALRVSVGGVDVPLAGGVRPDRVAMSVTATVTDLVVDVARAGPDGSPIAPERVGMPRVVATVSASPGAPPRVGVEGAFEHAGQPFALTLDSTLHGLFLAAPADDADPMSVVSARDVRPEMTLTLTDAPATLARLASPGLVQIGGRPADLVLLTRDTLGRTFGATVETFPNPNNEGASRYRVSFAGENAVVNAAGGLAIDRVRIDSGEVRLGVTPRVARHLSGLLAPDAPVAPELTETARVLLALSSPFEMVLTESFAPDLTQLYGQLDARASLDAALAAVTLPAAEGAEPMVVPPLRIRGLAVDVTAPKTVLGAEGGEAAAKLSGAVLTADGSTLVNIAGGVNATLKNGAPVGDTPITLTLSEIASGWIDELLGQPALVSGSLGERFAVAVEASPARWRSRVSPKPFVTLAVESPRFSTDKPIGLSASEKLVFLSERVEATWVMGPRWANLFLLGSPPDAPMRPAFAFTEQTRATVELRRFALAVTEGAGLFTPGLFNVDMTATIPDLPAELSDGRSMRVGGLSLRVGRGPTPDQLAFVLDVPRMKLGDGPEMTPTKRQITGRVSSYVDAGGSLTPDAARLTISGGIAPIPTEVIDAFARQNGLLRDALGPTVDFSIDAQNFSKQGGSLLVKAETAQASATIKGEIADGLLVIDPAGSPISVSVITPALAQRFQKALPMVASFEKTREDSPLRVVFDTPLELPIDGNMDRLHGNVTLEIGTARFSTSSWFQKVLAVTQQKTAGQVGKRMPPMKITIDKGLVSYAPYRLPFGEFTIETSGSINLSTRARQTPSQASLGAGQLEVISYIPTGAVASEAVPALRQLELPVVGNVSRLPVRTVGPIASPSTNLATDMMGRELIDTPGRLLQDLFGGGKK